MASRKVKKGFLNLHHENYQEILANGNTTGERATERPDQMGNTNNKRLSYELNSAENTSVGSYLIRKSMIAADKSISNLEEINEEMSQHSENSENLSTIKK